MATREVTDDTFEAEVLKSEVPVVVDFSAEWCGPCKAIAPALAEIADSLGSRAKIVTVDVDSNHRTAAKYFVRAMPTLMIFKQGQVAASRQGAALKGVLQSWIEQSIQA